MATPTPQQNGHGIQNARVSTSDERFNEHAEGRLARAQFLKGNESKQRRFAANDSRYEEDTTQETSTGGAYNARRTFSEAGVPEQTDGLFTGEELQEFRGTVPTTPSFPFFILFLALLKDFLDVIGAVTLIGWILLLPLTVCLSIILFLWTLSRLRMSYMKKRRLLKILIRLIAFGIEMLGYINVIPLATFFVLFTHYDESKIVKMVQSGLNALMRVESRIKGKAL